MHSSRHLCSTHSAAIHRSRRSPRSHLAERPSTIFLGRFLKLRALDSRSRSAALSGVTALAGKIVSLGTNVVVVRLAYRYLGAERYGMWVTLTSIVMMLSFADLGMSNGLINLVAEALGHDHSREAQRAVSSGLWMLGLVAMLLAGAAALASPFVVPAKIFNVHSAPAVAESGPALLAFFICFLLNLPLGAIRSAQAGMQQGYCNHLWGILGSVLSLMTLIAALHLRASLPVLVVCLSAPPLAASVLNAIQLFLWSHPELTPAPSAFCRSTASRLFRTGTMYFLMQLSLAVGMQTDNVVIAQILGSAAVADYAIPARLFGMVNAFLVLCSAALLPAYADAAARSDRLWIRKTFFRAASLGTSVTLATVVILVLFCNPILALWIAPNVRAPLPLLFTLAAQCLINAYLQPLCFLLNGVGQFRQQAISAVLMAILNLGLSIFFVRQFGIVGAVLGTVLALIMTQVVPLSLAAKHVLHELPVVSTPLAVQPSCDSCA